MNKYEEALENVRAEWGTSDRDINILEELVEKATPRTPEYVADGYADGELVYDTWVCPNCGTSYEVDYDEFEYCPNCGQKLLWEDE